jgi:hypothetical protein
MATWAQAVNVHAILENIVVPIHRHVCNLCIKLPKGRELLKEFRDEVELGYRCMRVGENAMDAILDGEYQKRRALKAATAAAVSVAGNGQSTTKGLPPTLHVPAGGLVQQQQQQQQQQQKCQSVRQDQIQILNSIPPNPDPCSISDAQWSLAYELACKFIPIVVSEETKMAPPDLIEVCESPYIRQHWRESTNSFSRFETRFYRL